MVLYGHSVSQNLKGELMADPTRRPDAGDAAREPDRRPATAPPRAPRWVKVSAIVVVVLVLLVVVVKLTGVAGSGHGPGRHTGAGEMAFSVTALPASTAGSAGPAGS